MFGEVQKIKLEELNRQEKQYNEKVRSLRVRQDEIMQELWRLKREQDKGITIRDDFTLFEKWMTRRRQYKEFKAQTKRIAELPVLISEMERKLEEATQELEKSEEYVKLNEIQNKISSVKEARTLYEMGITPMEAIELLERNGMQPVLSETDQCIDLHPRDYSSKSSLIGVHKTNHSPTANQMKSAKDANVEYTKSITINGVQYEYSYKAVRDTVHMSMNDEVSSHAFGSWDNCPYAILIPFADIPNEKIGSAEPMDTFTRGSIDLTENTWILCPKDEVDKLKQFNPKVHVLGYEGESVQGFPRPFLTQLGYRAEEVTMWNWRDEESVKQFKELMGKEGLETGAHSATYFYENESVLIKINEAVSITKLLRDQHLITKPEDMDDIMQQLAGSLQSYERLLGSLVSFSTVRSIGPDAVMGNHKQVSIFLEEMRKNGFYISTVYQEILERLCRISIHNYQKTDRDKIFALPEETPDEERKTIEELEAALTPKGHDYVTNDEKNSAFGKFISTVICDSILHSQERKVATEKLSEPEER